MKKGAAQIAWVSRPYPPGVTRLDASSSPSIDQVDFDGQLYSRQLMVCP
jgi:hypothetical protein